MTTAEILDSLRENYPECLLADGFDDAIVGIVEGCARPTVICYDFARCVQVLIESSDMDEEEAEEFLAFNTVGAYVGQYTPLFLHNWRSESYGNQPESDASGSDQAAAGEVGHQGDAA